MVKRKNVKVLCEDIIRDIPQAIAGHINIFVE